jgi:GNAT superfamily N-acetyltransferase
VTYEWLRQAKLLKYREITEEDIPALFAVRTATDENRLSREELSSLGITEDSVRERLRGTFKGWLCQDGDLVTGFSMGDKATGELWVIAVLPEYVGRGIGSRLLTLVENWLSENGCSKLWLTTDIDKNLRAYSFYRSHGWVDTWVEDGLRYMAKKMI